MKIALPIAQGKLCMHFGHCEVFAVLTVDESRKTILSREYLTPPPHEPGVLPAWLGQQNVNVIIAGGMGQRAQQLFAQQNIAVIVGAPAASLDELTEAYLSGTLISGTNACDH